MLSFTLQDWTTISGSSTTPLVQSVVDYLDLEAFADIVFWLEVLEVTNPTMGNVSVIYETSPTLDDSLFQQLGFVPAATVGGPTVTKAMLNASTFQPLGRYARWKLQSTGSGNWDITFRIQATVGMGAVGAFSPLQLPGLALWLRADQGVTVSGGKVTGWADLSGNGNNVSQSTGANQPTLLANAIGGRPAINFAGTTWLASSSSNIVSAPGTAYSVLAVAKNGSGALFTLRQSNTYSSSLFFGVNTWVHGDGVNGFANVSIADSSAITNSATSAFKSAHAYRGGANNPNIYLNGVGPKTITSVGTHQTTENGTTGFVVASNAASQTWGGLISEIIVCTGTITDAYRQRVEAYQLGFFGV